MRLNQRHTGKQLGSRVLLVAVILLMAPTARAQGDAATAVARLRQEVDTLAQRLQDQRRTARDELAALRAERNELQRQLRLEEVRARTLAQLEAQRQHQEEDLMSEAHAWVAPAREALAAAKRYVGTSLPFKIEERRALLAAIESQLSGAHPDAARAMTRLWRFVEEEESMAREIGMAQQVVVLDGERRLVDVARIGMAAMYVRSPEGPVGWAVRGSEGWRFATLTDSASVSVVEDIFTALLQHKVYGERTVLVPQEPPRTKAVTK